MEVSLQLHVLESMFVLSFLSLWFNQIKQNSVWFKPSNMTINFQK